MKKAQLTIVTYCVVWLLSCASSASADVITSCGGSSGHGYFFPGENIPADAEGWHSDEIAKGGIIFTLDGDNPDIILRDATGKTRSVKEDNAIVKILHVEAHKGTILVMVYYRAGALEHYLFKLDNAGTGQVVWGTAKAAGPIIANKLMAANCHK
jgi:hypothetical protein